MCYDLLNAPHFCISPKRILFQNPSEIQNSSDSEFVESIYLEIILELLET